MQLGDIRVLAIDTVKAGHVEGELTAPQLDWLARKLAEKTTGLTLILMHHPAHPSCVDSLDAMALKAGRTEFSALIAAYPGPLRILSGHIHRPFQTIWQGKFCATGGSPVFQHALDLTPGAHEPGAISEPYRYFVHKIDGPDAVTIHSRYVAL
jgi:3',5'-cyclic AMP phosphodiesterase CpdA